MSRIAFVAIVVVFVVIVEVSLVVCCRGRNAKAAATCGGSLDAGTHGYTHRTGKKLSMVADVLIFLLFFSFWLSFFGPKRV